ncbi:hypothetical protein T440DRAFT_542572 [Plenodomus tracheiphilus IPT5]|uniref:Uncharacterized protein n=1 Tax=Plenodomus tracheiphilus IPT5 TaxID=1408161 RepID=A0A6A7ASD5_9PLEO|nr:hypothetical protein T440DRAFT_542572 [Plenodomus tracheiphilus IPT5]
MPFHDQESEDFDRDCATFPAYLDYLYGPDKRNDYYGEEEGTIPFMPQQPILYTHSTPSQTQTYGDRDRDKSIATIDLRHPADALDAGPIPQQSVLQNYNHGLGERFSPSEPHRQTHGSASSPVGTPTASGNVGRRSAQDSAVSLPLPQSAKRVLVRSSSATDIEEDVMRHGQKRRKTEGIVSSAPPPLSTMKPGLGSSNVRPDLNPELEQLNNCSLLRPGDLLQDPRFAFIREARRQQINTNITQLWADWSKGSPAVTLRLNMVRDITRKLHTARIQWEQGNLQGQNQQAGVPQSAPVQETKRSDEIRMPQNPFKPSEPQQYQQAVQQQDDIAPVLRENLDRFAPTAWAYLQLAIGTDRTSKMYAISKLEAMKTEIPSEGYAYLQKLLWRMTQASKAGEDPLSVIGS